MIASRLKYWMLGLVILTGVPAGCAGPAPQIPVSAAAPQGNFVRSGLALLYTIRAEKKHSGYRSTLAAYAFPNGRAVYSLSLHGRGSGLCSDTSGNVWAVMTTGKQHTAYEYAHGGKTSIASIHIGDGRGSVGDCAVDPTTGDLAVLGQDAGSGTDGYVKIWRGAQGKPAIYPIGFEPTACAYDASGNLFVDGFVGSTVVFDLAELVMGAKSFDSVRLTRGGDFYPGGLAWDGTYLDVVTQGRAPRASLFRVAVTRSRGHVVDVVLLNGLYVTALIAIDGKTIAGTSGQDGHIVSMWPYPSGGKPTKNVAQYRSGPSAITISVP
jgi:hypothetical protein